MKKMKTVTILGTRPEIIKMSPLLAKFDSEFENRLVHTDQHYDDNMSGVFFKELGLRRADYYLNAGSGSHASQAAAMLVGIENILLDEAPRIVVVQGDTNTTLAGALVAAKLKTLLVHIEAGCRSFNKKMPEEINRIVADHCSDILFAPDGKSKENLLREGIGEDKVHIVGSTAHEACLRNIEYAESSNILNKLKLADGGYLVVTIHRAENTEISEVLANIIDALNYLAKTNTIVFSVHPRTKKIIFKNGLILSDNVIITDPLGYLDFLKLLKHSKLVMTDSGGVQEESAVLGKVCLIVRNETEWMQYVKLGRNELIGNSKNAIISFTEELLKNPNRLAEKEAIKIEINAGTSDKIISILRSKNVCS